MSDLTKEAAERHAALLEAESARLRRCLEAMKGISSADFYVTMLLLLEARAELLDGIAAAARASECDGARIMTLRLVQEGAKVLNDGIDSLIAMALGAASAGTDGEA